MNGTNVVLTAGHCLYDEKGKVDGTPDYFANKFPLYFIPGNGFVDNGGSESEARSAPYGAWQVARHAVPQCWASEANSHCDVGVAILSPNGSGEAGNVVGAYQWVTGACCSVGQVVQSAGYPGDRGFADYAHGWGNAPYQCTNQLEEESGLVGGAAGDGFLQFHRCAATGGTSGGPVWTQLSDRKYYLIGVNNKGSYSPPDAPFSEAGAFQPFDGTMQSFYCAAIGCGGAAKVRRSTRPVTTPAPTGTLSTRRATFRSLGLNPDGTPKEKVAR